MQWGVHSVYFPDESQFDISKVKLDGELVEILQSLKDPSAAAALRSCVSARDFMGQLELLVNSISTTALREQRPVRKNHFVETQLSQRVMAELDALGWEKVVDICDSFKLIK